MSVPTRWAKRIFNRLGLCLSEAPDSSSGAQGPTCRSAALAMRSSFLALMVFTGACGGAGSDTLPGLDAGVRSDGGARLGNDAGLSDGVDAGGPTVALDAGQSAPGDAGQPPGADGGGSVDAGATYANGTTPDVAGPYALSTVSGKVTNGSRQTPVVAHLPVGLGPSPVIVFLPGANLNTSMYLATVERLASHGFVVIRADPAFSIFNVDHVAMMKDARAAIDWALSASGPLAGRVDSTRVGVMGHSLGGKLAIMTAFADARVGAVFGIDPVNAQSPDVVPDQFTPLAVPLGFAGETLDSTGGGMLCAPAAGNYTTFYEAATSAPWSAEWTFASIGHLDFVDACTGLSCGFCKTSSGDKVKARADLHTLTVAFFRKHFRGDVGVDAWLTGASVGSEITTRHR